MKKKENKKIDHNEITELLWAISNAAHAEYHFIEALMINSPKWFIDPKIGSYIVELRHIRIELMNRLAIEIPGTNALWCTLKHLLLTEFHCFELFEKTSNDFYLHQAQKIHVLVDEMISNDTFEDFKTCPRCKDDKLK